MLAGDPPRVLLAARSIMEGASRDAAVRGGFQLRRPAWSSSYGFSLGGAVPWPPPQRSSSSSSYTCGYCKREFRSAQALGGHMNVHRRERARLRHFYCSSPAPTRATQRSAAMPNLNFSPPGEGGGASTAADDGPAIYYSFFSTGGGSTTTTTTTTKAAAALEVNLELGGGGGFSTDVSGLDLELRLGC